MKSNTFYDIHMHALNLSHPYLLAFVQRFKIHQLLIASTILSIMGPFFPSFITNRLNKVKNLLSVMENDIGSFFILMENCLIESKDHFSKDDGLRIGNRKYTKIVLTPLMMDFGYKGIKTPGIHYNEPSQKPIVEQVTDVFNGIKKYQSTSTHKLFEIYPFLGLNTRNYSIGKIQKMLDKYFDKYDGSRDNFHSHMGKFDGDIENLSSGSFAGVKVYPPLGFNPWPDKDEKELAKVNYLYDYCSVKGIPITCHGSESGFVVVTKKQRSEFAKISKWGQVLEQYPELKLNLAHFPLQEKFLMIFPKRRRLKEILALVLKYDNVYVDFSNRAVNEKYYKALRQLMDNSSGEGQDKLKRRLLFGSDFTVNLMSVESYNEYLSIFSKNSFMTEEEKHSVCSTNPERFLFSKPQA